MYTRPFLAALTAAALTACTDPPVGQEQTVNMLLWSYAPNTLMVTPGTTVAFVNNDFVPHTVTSRDGGPLASGHMPRFGSVYTYTFNEVGEFPYFCVYHPFMEGKVIVREAAR